MPENVQIIFRGTEEYRHLIKRAALDRKLTVQQFLEQCVSGALEAGPGATEPMLSPKLQATVDLFLRFLESGAKEDVHIVQSLLSRFKKDSAQTGRLPKDASG